MVFLNSINRLGITYLLQNCTFILHSYPSHTHTFSLPFPLFFSPTHSLMPSLSFPSPFLLFYYHTHFTIILSLFSIPFPTHSLSPTLPLPFPSFFLTLTHTRSLYLYPFHSPPQSHSLFLYFPPSLMPSPSPFPFSFPFNRTVYTVLPLF